MISSESIRFIRITNLDVMTIGIVSVTSIEMVHGVLVGVHGGYQWLGSLREKIGARKMGKKRKTRGNEEERQTVSELTAAREKKIVSKWTTARGVVTMGISEVKMTIS